MQSNHRRFSKPLTLIIISVFLVAFISAPGYNPSVHQPSSPSCYASDAYLMLSVEPSHALPNTLVTLNIVYHRVGNPYTGIAIDHPELVIFDPPLTMPCKYDEHITHCTSITFRTQSTGVVHFTAGAEGEVFGDECQCWCYTAVHDNGPATLVIANTISYAFLPSVYH